MTALRDRERQRVALGDTQLEHLEGATEWIQEPVEGHTKSRIVGQFLDPIATDVAGGLRDDFDRNRRGHASQRVAHFRVCPSGQVDRNVRLPSAVRGNCVLYSRPIDPSSSPDAPARELENQTRHDSPVHKRRHLFLHEAPIDELACLVLVKRTPVGERELAGLAREGSGGSHRQKIPRAPRATLRAIPTVKSFAIVTFGCQMNAHDSERMSEVLRGAGYAEVGAPNEADVILLNTCSVREKAEQKLRSEVGRLIRLKLDRKDLIIGVAGCVAQQEGEKLLARVPELDLVLGPDNIPELPALLADLDAGAPPRVRT